MTSMCVATHTPCTNSWSALPAGTRSVCVAMAELVLKYRRDTGKSNLQLSCVVLGRESAILAIYDWDKLIRLPKLVCWLRSVCVAMTELVLKYRRVMAKSNLQLSCVVLGRESAILAIYDWDKLIRLPKLVCWLRSVCVAMTELVLKYRRVMAKSNLQLSCVVLGRESAVLAIYDSDMLIRLPELVCWLGSVCVATTVCHHL
ncbi:hypothetical protein J6590_004818 [Homalodisca vitripennis]|nr:hypothetical protein J6590_004818 [Homalodisca vitripennis]